MTPTTVPDGTSMALSAWVRLGNSSSRAFYDGVMSRTSEVPRISVADLSDRALRSLEIYCDPASRYAWPSYDIDHTPSELTPTDLLAPALLSYPIRGDHLQRILQHESDPNPYARFRQTLEHVVAITDVDDSFGEIPATALDQPDRKSWAAVLASFEATRTCPGLTAVAASKILHRKRPNLVPVIDSRVRTFYKARSTASLLTAIHHDLVTHADLLDTWRGPHMLPNAQPMTRLRALDIVIWMRKEKI